MRLRPGSSRRWWKCSRPWPCAPRPGLDRATSGCRRARPPSLQDLLARVDDADDRDGHPGRAGPGAALGGDAARRHAQAVLATGPRILLRGEGKPRAQPMTRTNPAQNVPFGHRHPAELPHPICAPIEYRACSLRHPVAQRYAIFSPQPGVTVRRSVWDGRVTYPRGRPWIPVQSRGAKWGAIIGPHRATLGLHAHSISIALSGI